MKIPYFCCIGAELKRYAKDFDFMNQVYLYKVPADDSIEEVLVEDYFKAISDSVLQDDLVYIYEASAETLHSCRFDKQNGHITAIPLASDETLTGAVTTIIHDNLTKNRAVISNNDGKIAVSEVTSTELGYLHGATSNIQEQLNGKAKTDLSNLTSAGKNIANWSTNVTNCITESPQDIILEINGSNGLTLKSGSKLYQPNGSETFTQITIESDKQRNDLPGWSTGTYVVFYSPSYASGGGSGIIATGISRSVSGATDPLSTTGRVWYDTTNNRIKLYESGSYTRVDLSFPLAIVEITNGTGITKIVETFNGRGVMGKTAFVLPNFTALIPNRYNTDGTLKSTTVKRTDVGVYTLSSVTAGHSYDLCISSSGIAFFYTPIEYNAKENLNYAGGTATTWMTYGRVVLDSNGAITSIELLPVFHAVDYNDTDFIAHQATPSSKYIDLTLGNDGDTYKVPANGFVFLSKKSTSAGQLVFLINDTASKIRVYSVSTDSGQDIGSYIPVKKDDVVRIYYNVAGATNYFRFVYADGSK